VASDGQATSAVESDRDDTLANDVATVAVSRRTALGGATVDRTLFRRLGLLAMIGVLGACGPADPETRAGGGSPAWLDGVHASSRWTVQVVDAGPRGVILIDTASDHGHRVVEARWFDDSGERRAVDHDRPALVFARAWTAAGLAFVAGITCPEPELEDIDAIDADPASGCGGHRPAAVIRVLDLASGSWSEVRPQVPLLMGRVLNVVSPGATSVLLSGGMVQALERPALYRVDLDSGATEVVETAGSPDPPTACPVTGGTLVHAAPTPDPQRPAAVGELTLLNGREHRSLGRTAAGLLKVGCIDGGMMFWDPRSGTFSASRVDDGRVRSTPVAPPGNAGRDTSLRLAGEDRVAARPSVWVEDGAGFHLWRFEVGRWIALGPTFAGLDPPPIAAVIGDHVVIESGDAPIEIGVA
jgi:hypothetical protein